MSNKMIDMEFYKVPTKEVEEVSREEVEEISIKEMRKGKGKGGKKN